MSASAAAVGAPQVEGQMAAAVALPVSVDSLGSGDALYTLNEPIISTFMRDLRRVGKKLKTVLVPLGAEADTLKELRDWDLWGPLLLCLVLSIITSARAPSGQHSLVFAGVFVLVWVGAAVVTLNAKLLGGKISFFQSVCVLGYCVCPLVIAAVLGLFLSSAVWKVPIVIGAFFWSCRASIVFMSEMMSPNRRLLAVFPVALFYMVVSWMVFMV